MSLLESIMANQVSLTWMVIVLVLLNIALVCMCIYIIIAIRDSRREYQNKFIKYETALFVLKDYCNNLQIELEKRNKIIDNMEKRMLSFKKDIEHVNFSMSRFAPPLDRDTEYKSITVSGTIL